MPKEILGAIDHYAEEDRRTRSNWIVHELSQIIEEREKEASASDPMKKLDEIAAKTTVVKHIGEAHDRFAVNEATGEPDPHGHVAKTHTPAPTKARRALKSMIAKENAVKKTKE